MRKLSERIQSLQAALDSDEGNWDPEFQIKLMDELYGLYLEALSFLQKEKEWAIGIEFGRGMPILDIPSTKIIIDDDSAIVIVDNEGPEIRLTPILHLVQIIEGEKDRHREAEKYLLLKGMEDDEDNIFHFPTVQGPIPVLFRKSFYDGDLSPAWEVYFPEHGPSLGVTSKGVHILSEPVVSYGRVWYGEKFGREESLPELIESIYRLQKGHFYGMEALPVDNNGHLLVPESNPAPFPRKWRG